MHNLIHGLLVDAFPIITEAFHKGGVSPFVLDIRRIGHALLRIVAKLSLEDRSGLDR